MLPTPFSFVWVLHTLIGYSRFLRNGLHFFQLDIFVNVKTFHDFTVFFQTHSLRHGSY